MTSLLRSSLRLSPYLPAKTPSTGEPWQPTEPQAAFLVLDDKEILYGGAAGGGKSDALLAAALQYVDTPGYAALILRRTYPDLAKPGAIMHRAKEWMAPHRAAGTVHWDDKGKVFTFPSGATLSFGYLQHAEDHLQYQGAEFQYVAFDELTQFREHQYRYLFSRLRKPDGMNVPLRMRAASNPGGPGHEWVKLRWALGVDPQTGLRQRPPAGRVFIPARLQDNPHVDQTSYLASLDELGVIERMQLLQGDWGARPPGEMFQSAWFYAEGRLLDVIPSGLRLVRYWDLASTKKRKESDDPDWTAGHLMGWDSTAKLTVSIDQIREQDTPGSIETLIRSTAEADRLRYGHVVIRMEQEPGSSGVAVIDTYARTLRGYDFAGVRSTGSKTDRAQPFARWVERGFHRTVRGDWVPDWVDEHEAFPQEGLHDDQVDSTDGAFLELAHPTAASASSPPLPVSQLTDRSLRQGPASAYHSQRGRLLNGGRRAS